MIHERLRLGKTSIGVLFAIALMTRQAFPMNILGTKTAGGILGTTFV